jgi:molybdate/tungstate transport system substrate-binding protein
LKTIRFRQYGIAFLILILIGMHACTTKKEKETQKVIIFHAGSLSVPLAAIAEAFKKEHPDIELIMEAAGSRHCARKITDLGKDCDIILSADYAVIDNLLIPEYATWNIQFASNEMAIVYHEDSRYSEIINEHNCFDVLLKEDVVFGRSDPNSDPCGYRAVLSIKLAENLYQIENLTRNLLQKNTNYIRPKESDLLALLESKNLDYIFLYRSLAEQHGLKYIQLSDSINLKNPLLSDHYAGVSIDISGKKPGTLISRKGEAMIYGMSILKHALHPEAALIFADFFLNREKGGRIMEKAGQPGLVPSFSETYNNIPEKLKKYASNKQ